MTPEDDERDVRAVDAVRAGDTSAFAAIVAAYRISIYGIACRYLGSPDEAEDAVQDIFVKAFRFIDRFDARRPFAPWLYRLAINHLRTAYLRLRRAAHRSASTDLDTLSDTRPQAEEQLDTQSTAEQVRAAVAALPVSLQEVVVLYYFQDLSTDETAHRLGIGRENVKSRLFRARKRLRTVFEAVGDRPVQPDGPVDGSSNRR